MYTYIIKYYFKFDCSTADLIKNIFVGIKECVCVWRVGSKCGPSHKLGAIWDMVSTWRVFY